MRLSILAVLINYLFIDVDIETGLAFDFSIEECLVCHDAQTGLHVHVCCRVLVSSNLLSKTVSFLYMVRVVYTM